VNKESFDTWHKRHHVELLNLLTSLGNKPMISDYGAKRHAERHYAKPSVDSVALDATPLSFNANEVLFRFKGFHSSGNVMLKVKCTL
jgi:hypothetical protein